MLVRHSEDQPCPLVDDWVWGRTGGTVVVIVPCPRDDSVIADNIRLIDPVWLDVLKKQFMIQISTSGDVSEVLHQVTPSGVFPGAGAQLYAYPCPGGHWC